MPKWSNFNEYMQWRESTDQVHNMDHGEALKWVLSALGIMDNPDINDKSQKDQINDALSSPLSSYPDKLEELSTQLQLKQSSKWPQIAAVIGSPEKNTVSRLVSVISANATPKKTLSDSPAQPDHGDGDGHEYREPDGKSPL